jgi:hypothetical protein
VQKTFGFLNGRMPVKNQFGKHNEVRRLVLFDNGFNLSKMGLNITGIEVYLSNADPFLRFFGQRLAPLIVCFKPRGLRAVTGMLPKHEVLP